MRRLVVSALAGFLGVILAGAGVTASSAADPSPTSPAASTPTYKPGEPVCTITDAKLIGLSGLIVTDTGFVTITDSNGDKSAIKIWFLDQNCKLTKSVAYPTAPFDPEDLALGKDGTIWVADIGDNYSERQPPGGRGIGLWKLAPGSSTPQIFRYSYPDSAHDAEALLLAADDTPIFVTKNSQGSKLYVPTAPADPSGKAVALKEVGSFTPQHTGTPNSLSVVGEKYVTGGANSADRKKVVLRTYADAYEWDVPDGDVVKAITTTAPRVTPLPNEQAGEGIAYSPDGKLFYTIEDVETPPIKTPILKYTPSKAPAAGSTTTAGSGKSSGGGGLPLTLSQITYLVIGVGVLGLLLLGGGVMGIVRSRKRRARRLDDDWDPDDEYDEDYDDYDDYDDRRGRRPVRSGSRSGGRGVDGVPPGGFAPPPGAAGFPPVHPGYGAPGYGAPAPASPAYGAGARGGGTVYGAGGGQNVQPDPYQQGYPQAAYDHGYQGDYGYQQGGYDQGGYGHGGYEQEYAEPQYGGQQYYDQGYQDPGYHGAYPDPQYDGYQDRRR